MKDVKNGNRTLQIWKHNGNTFIRDGDEDCIELTPSNIQEVVNIVLQLNGIGITPSPSSLTWEEVLKEAEKYADKGAAYFEHGSGKTITRLTLIIDYLQRYPLHPPMEWVKVEDANLEDGKLYQINFINSKKENDVTIAYYRNGRWLTYYSALPIIYPVTHCQPLAEPLPPSPQK